MDAACAPTSCRTRTESASVRRRPRSGLTSVRRPRRWSDFQCSSGDISCRLTSRQVRTESHTMFVQSHTQCWFYVGPASTTLGQHRSNMRSQSRDCWSAHRAHFLVLTTWETWNGGQVPDFGAELLGNSPTSDHLYLSKKIVNKCAHTLITKKTNQNMKTPNWYYQSKLSLMTTVKIIFTLTGTPLLRGLAIGLLVDPQKDQLVLITALIKSRPIANIIL